MVLSQFLVNPMILYGAPIVIGVVSSQLFRLTMYADGEFQVNCLIGHLTMNVPDWRYARISVVVRNWTHLGEVLPTNI